jgi:hypothetical protein
MTLMMSWDGTLEMGITFDMVLDILDRLIYWNFNGFLFLLLLK